MAELGRVYDKIKAITTVWEEMSWWIPSFVQGNLLHSSTVLLISLRNSHSVDFFWGGNCRHVRLSSWMCSQNVLCGSWIVVPTCMHPLQTEEIGVGFL